MFLEAHLVRLQRGRHMWSAIQTLYCNGYVETDLLELGCAFPNGGRDWHRVGRMVGQNYETGVSIPHHLAAIAIHTIGQRRHPRLHRVRETLDQGTYTQDGGMQGSKRVRVRRVPAVGEFRAPQRVDEAILFRETLSLSAMTGRVEDTYPQRDDALTLRASDNPREHLRGHFSNLDVLIRQALL